MAKPALGRGLGALLGGGVPPAREAAVKHATPAAPAPVADSAAAVTGGSVVQRVSLDRIRPCPFQPRKDFSEEALRELADSIQAQGIVQPLIVRDKGDHLELIAGERRWRAAQILKLSEVPVLVREADDAEVLELALIENLQRENLNPMEEALGYSQLLEQFHLTQEEVAAKVGKSRAAVANSLRLLKLPPMVQQQLRAGRLSVGHAKVILGLGGAEEQNLAAERVLKQGLNVRQTEELVAEWLERSAKAPAVRRAGGLGMRDTHVAALEQKLQERLGTKVHLIYRNGKGQIDIRFFNDDDLERITELLGISSE